MTKYSLLASLALLATSPSSAATIVGLFNTGTGADDLALGGGAGIVDPHYRIVASTEAAFVGQQAVTYNNQAYVPEDANSRWISMNAGGGVSFSTSIYRLSFDLTGLDHTNATITGRFGADNLVSIILNDQVTGIDAPAQFTALTGFTLSSGFVAGVNTLDFRVVDGGGPTALRVDDLIGTAGAVNAIPEPATWAMMIIGFGAVGTFARAARRMDAPLRALA